MVELTVYIILQLYNQERSENNVSNKEKTIRPRGYIEDIAVHCDFDELKDLEKIIPSPMNPNTHNQEQIELLARVIQRQGWRRPIIISRRSGCVVIGEGRLLAARHLGISKAPVEYQNYSSQDEEYADMVTDNKIAGMSDFDQEILCQLLSEMDLSMLDITGYGTKELTELFEGFETIEQSISDNTEIDAERFDISEFSHICPRCNFAFND